MAMRMGKDVLVGEEARSHSTAIDPVFLSGKRKRPVFIFFCVHICARAR
jgi:hypothetical protein